MVSDGNGRMQLERVTTGVDALDEILGGGIPRYSIVFVAGPPGTGKTVLCQQALFANTRTASSVLYLSTLAEPVLKMMRYGQTFSFFNTGQVGREVTYADLGGALSDDGAEGVLEELDRLITEHRPEFLVIDSFKVLREFFTDVAAFRQFTSNLMSRLAAWEVTSILVGEYAHDDIWELPEFGIADGIIYLYGTEEPRRQKRFMRVMKMRGTDFFSGQHFFEITGDGIALFPRLDPRSFGEYQAPPAHAGSAIEGLNEMMGGGMQSGTSALIIGGAGTGKTLAAMSFLVEGARKGVPGLFVSFEEGVEQLVRNGEPFGWDLGGLMERRLLDIYHVPPSELDVDRHAILFKERAHAIKAGRVAVDTITAIEASVLDRTTFQAHLWTIIDNFKRSGVTILMTHEVAASPLGLRAGETGLPSLADTIISLSLAQAGGELRKTLAVVKIRGEGHDNAIRDYIIAPPRIAVGDVFSADGR